MPSKKKANTQVHATNPQPLPLKNPSKDAPTSLPNTGPPNSSSPPFNSQSAAIKPDADLRTGDTTESAGEPAPTPAVNRKKQKRREKEAAKRAVEHDKIEVALPNGHVAAQSRPNGHLPPVRQGRGPAKGYFTEEPDYPGPADSNYPDLGSPEEAFYSGDEDPSYEGGADAMPDSSWLNTSKRKKSKTTNETLSRTSTMLSRTHIPPLSSAAMRASQRLSSEHIWNTSTQAERDNIKQFWLELGEEERRSLVKVEKEAVLRKMKEQQKHSCSCSVCGRKRTAIEEELEVLYDAYYEELEQFANHNADLANAPALMAPPRTSYARAPLPMAGSYPSRGRIDEIDEDEEDLEEDDEEDYDDDEDEGYSDDEGELDGHGLPPGPPDFFQFGNSLTVKDGILTVADDLLKNDGKHFIDMMEQLAERRMQREKEVHYPSLAYAHRDFHQGHNHPPIDDDDDDYDDEDDDEDYDSQEEDDYEGDDMDSMTEEQRMEEGRRMFQIFAARMFEQRVLTAYREKVAAERQRKLLEELDEEDRLDGQREAKKAREAAKKKEKKRLQKQAKDEEKAKKDADKAAQEAAVREAEDKKLEEQRQHREEQRKKREAEKKAADEERLRKESDKHRKQQEARDRQTEQERKVRDAKERERQKREESKKKERDDREAKEKEVKDQKAKEEQERKAHEEHARRQKEIALRAETRTVHHQQKHQPVALPPGLQPPSRVPSMYSPHVAVATPAMPPKVPTPVRNRQTSQPGPASHGSSPRSQKASTEMSQSSASPATVAMPQTPAQGHPAKIPIQPPPLMHPQPSAPRSPLNNHGRGQYPFHMNGLPGLGVSGPPMGAQGMMPNMMPPMMFQAPPALNQQRFAQNGLQYPPGFSRGPFQPGQQMPFVPQPPGQAPPIANQQPPAPLKSNVHSRQPSNEHAPIGRPGGLGPIARPSSTTPDKQRPQHKTPDAEVDQLATQLGSKALLDDSDTPFDNDDPRIGLPPVGPPGSTRLPFANSFPDHKQEPFGMSGGPGWGGFNPGMAPSPHWGPPGMQRPGPGWGQPPFGSMGSAPPPIPRSHLPRPIAVRLMLVQACRHLSQIPGANADGHHPVQAVLRQLEALKVPREASVSMDEMLGICDTEGNSQNGGGSFEVVMDKSRGQVVKFLEDAPSQPRGSVGEIGSPILGHSQHIHSSPLGGIVGQPVGQTNNFGPPGRSF